MIKEFPKSLKNITTQAKDREIQQLRRDVDRALQIQKMEENLTKKMNQI